MKAFDYNNYSCIVSIDFGTTFSGCCYIHTDSAIVKNAVNLGDYKEVKNFIHNIKNWKSNNDKVIKVPTIVIYDRESKHLREWGTKAYEAWKKKDDNDELIKNGITLRKFKLKLKRGGDDEQQDTEPLDPKFDYMYKTATIDYLRNISEEAFAQIKYETAHVNVDKTKFRYILTVPAEWTEDERNEMRQMSIQAGIISKDDHENRLLIINESYAATLYCEREIAEVPRKFQFKETHRYLVCDAGGGTVDLATYESTAPFAEGEAVGRCQLTTDSGKKCGSGYVDDLMEKLLTEILFHGVEDDTTFNRKSVINILMVDFIEEFKLTFGENEHPSEEDDIVFEMGNLIRTQKDRMKVKPISKDSPEYTIELDDYGRIFSLTISYETVCRCVFDPIVNETIKLIDNQLKKANISKDTMENIDDQSKILATFLLGGFGKSPYLKKKIKEYFNEGKRAGEIINSEGQIDLGGETAAMRGAIYYGIDNLRSLQITSVNTVRYEDQYFDPDEYNMLVCFDIGYEVSRCGYFFLKENENSQVNKKFIDHKSIEWIEVKDSKELWPGKNDIEPYKIPTVLEWLGDEDDEDRQAKWGAEVDPKSKNKTTMNRIMSINKDEFHEFYQEYLTHIYNYACDYLKEKHKRRFDSNKTRYCLAVENCFNFFFTRDEVRSIAKNSLLITKEDNPKRLLLINREDAFSIFYEDDQFTNEDNTSSCSWNVELNGESNAGAFFFKEVELLTKKERIDNGAETTQNELKESEKTKVKFEFNFLFLLVKSINNYLENNTGDHIIRQVKEGDDEECSDSTHTDHCKQILQRSLVNFLAENPNFSTEKTETKHTIDSDCCSLSFIVSDFITHIVKPSVQELARQILVKISETEISKKYKSVDNLNITGNLMCNMPLLEANTENFKRNGTIDQNEIATILKLSLYKSELTVVNHIDDIRIIDKGNSDTQQGNLPLSNNLTLKSQDLDVIDKKKKAYLNHFLQIQIFKDCVYLTLHEATTISGINNVQANRNIRKLRSTTLQFNFVDSLFRYLQRFSISEEKKKNKTCSSHEKECDEYQEALLLGLLNYLKENINLEDNTDFKEKANQVHHPYGDCCSFQLSPHNFITQVLKPAIKDFIDEVYTQILQAEMIRQYRIDNIVIQGRFVEAKKDLVDLIKEIVFEKFSDLRICQKKEDIIEYIESEGNEVIYGAAIHGLYPTIHTQRISRRKYAVSVVAYNNIDDRRPVTLYYQPYSGSSKTEVIDPDKPLDFVMIGDKVTPEMQTTGIFKRFFADETCIAYASIYAADDEQYKKIHQFEVSLDREQKSNTQFKSRLNFEVRMVFPNNNETRFEANIMGKAYQKNIPEFRFRDQILVTNIYD